MTRQFDVWSFQLLAAAASEMPKRKTKCSSAQQRQTKFNEVWTWVFIQLGFNFWRCFSRCSGFSNGVQELLSKFEGLLAKFEGLLTRFEWFRPNLTGL